MQPCQVAVVSVAPNVEPAVLLAPAIRTSGAVLVIFFQLL